ncbi:MAG TPA: hypothetical protein VMX97_11725, partial [Hyphomicrobiaceae bacterium]|nr:hypothetical protein [Hyphomicrobiaceae bacterium]
MFLAVKFFKDQLAKPHRDGDERRGLALSMKGARVAGDIALNGGFQTIGGVALDRVRAGGRCDLDRSHMKSAVIASGMTTEPGLQNIPASRRQMPRLKVMDGYCCIVFSIRDATMGELRMPRAGSERPKGIVDFSRAKVDVFEDWAATWPPRAEKRAVLDGMDADHIVLDGFHYGYLKNPSGSECDERAGLRNARPGRQRIGWLAGQSASPARDRFVSQPWLQLANQLRGQGYRHDATLINIERCRREGKFRGAPLLWRVGSRVMDWTAVFGFRPGRTLAWMVCLMVVFAGIWSWASSSCREAGCFDGQVYVMTQRGAFTGHDLRETYPAFHPLGYSVDRFVPLLNLGYADRWRVNTN